ncbi:hypothetical protein BC937DRAFT_91633 [Endogone sp. FLAS-F59071]|nr:hypothetical protein BC937DRAFT_91633 [Endogone sp. FLAS-F59071]|eukprot:RUS16072.1 hypothetical protein BC937DRAFT_91633 [Endogone sp. FLAS-F59071]
MVSFPQIPISTYSKKSRKNREHERDRDRDRDRDRATTSSTSSTSSGPKQSDDPGKNTTVNYPEVKSNFSWIMNIKRGLKDDMLQYDNSDNARLQMLHIVAKCVDNGLYRSPVTEVLTEGGMVLDIG